MNEKKVLTDSDLSTLRQLVKPYLTPKRYLHTLAVEKEIVSLSGIFYPCDGETENRLRAAALLHDITKAFSLEKQLQYCDKFGIIIGKDDILSPKIFHAKTAAALCSADFAEYVDGEIVSGIRWHTTGRGGMTLFESLVYLADYIEETRTFEDCVTLRNFFYSSLKSGKRKEDVLRDTMILSFDMTLKILTEEGALIDSDTVEARNYFLTEKIRQRTLD